MIVAHRHARHGIGCRMSRLGHQASLEEQLIALQHQVLVPGLGAIAEAHLDPLLPLPPARRIAAALRPRCQSRQDGLGDQRRGAGPPVLPGEIAVPAPPFRIACAGRQAFAGETEIADRHDALPSVRGRPVAVGEGVELLDIAQRMVGLSFDPGAQAALQRRMFGRKGSGRQERAVLQRQHQRLVRRQGDQHCIEFDGNGVGGRGRRRHVGRIMHEPGATGRLVSLCPCPLPPSSGRSIRACPSRHRPRCGRVRGPWHRPGSRSAAG